jgi:hypothetical protein
MYGSDHGMEVMSESSDDEEEEEILQSPEGRAVSPKACPKMSKYLTLE